MNDASAHASFNDAIRRAARAKVLTEDADNGSVLHTPETPLAQAVRALENAKAGGHPGQIEAAERRLDVAVAHARAAADAHAAHEPPERQATFADFAPGPRLAAPARHPNAVMNALIRRAARGGAAGYQDHMLAKYGRTGEEPYA